VPPTDAALDHFDDLTGTVNTFMTIALSTGSDTCLLVVTVAMIARVVARLLLVSVFCVTLQEATDEGGVAWGWSATLDVAYYNAPGERHRELLLVAAERPQRLLGRTR
jgi:hypothetical protein